MLVINKKEKCEFDLDNYVLRIGDEASYNTYYAISLSYKNELFNIGLQAPDTGILPQVTIFNSHIIIGASQSIYIWEPNIREPIKYDLSAPFYELFIADDSVIIIYELGVIVLNKEFDKKWEKSFSEIIDIEKIENKVIFLRDFNGNLIKINALTGDSI